MQNLTNEQKADTYNKLLFKYQRLQEEIRLIQAQNINVSEEDERKIQTIKKEMEFVYGLTERLYR
jgi:hypothetical protein